MRFISTNTTLFIGDIHGRTTWNKSVYDALTKFKNIVFLGDYVDSFDITPDRIKDNLLEIIELKKKYPDRITLLLGNHDYAYVFGFDVSGFQYGYWKTYKEVFDKNWDLFDMAWGEVGKSGKYYLATHAGITNNYLKSINIYLKKTSKLGKIITKKMLNDITDLHNVLNYLKNEKELIWSVGLERGGFQYGSIIWADKNELLNDALNGINQIIGHTNQRYYEIRHSIDGDILYFCDAGSIENQGIMIDIV